VGPARARRGDDAALGGLGVVPVVPSRTGGEPVDVDDAHRTCRRTVGHRTVGSAGRVERLGRATGGSAGVGAVRADGARAEQRSGETGGCGPGAKLISRATV